MVVIVVLPLLEFVVEDLVVVDEDPVYEPIELFGVDAVGGPYLAIEASGARLDVPVAEPFVECVAVELGAECSRDSEIVRDDGRVLRLVP